MDDAWSAIFQLTFTSSTKCYPGNATMPYQQRFSFSKEWRERVCPSVVVCASAVYLQHVHDGFTSGKRIYSTRSPINESWNI